MAENKYKLLGVVKITLDNIYKVENLPSGSEKTLNMELSEIAVI